METVSTNNNDNEYIFNKQTITGMANNERATMTNMIKNTNCEDKLNE